MISPSLRHAPPPRSRRNLALALALALTAGCGDGSSGASLSARVPPAPPTTVGGEGPKAPSSSSSAPQAADAPPGDGGCTFDWVDLEQAFELCPVFDDVASAWVPRVRTRPEKLRVASGATLRFVVILGAAGKSASWSAELDDRGGAALIPILASVGGAPLDDPTSLLSPHQPMRARVTLSSHGAVTTSVTVKAVRRSTEQVVTGHRTAPSGAVVDVTEARVRETPLAAGSYVIELGLPTPGEEVVKLDLEVTPPA